MWGLCGIVAFQMIAVCFARFADAVDAVPGGVEDAVFKPFDRNSPGANERSRLS